MWSRFLKNRKGTAEVIGTIMFILILLFFFSSIYLWHDKAAREMNEFYIKRINSPITLSIMEDPHDLNVTNVGGMDAKLSILWVNVKHENGNNPDRFHGSLSIDNVIVPARSSRIIQWSDSDFDNKIHENDNLVFKVLTTVGNSASCNYEWR